MGQVWSSTTNENTENNVNVIPETGPDIISMEKPPDAGGDQEAQERKLRREQDLEKFREELAKKRELRKKRLGEVVDELKGLREQLQVEVTKREEMENKLKMRRSGQLKPEGDQDTDGGAGSNVNGDAPEEATEQVGASRCHEEPSGSSKEGGIEQIALSTSEDDDDISPDETEEHLEIMMKAKASNLKKGKNGKPKKKVVIIDPKESKVEEERNAEVHTTADGSPNGEDDGSKKEECDEEVDEMKDLEERNNKLQGQVKALKDVAALSRQLLGIRENQVEELNKKLVQLEETGQEYERKMLAMRELRRLYDERGRAVLAEHRQKLDTERTRVSVLESKLAFSQDVHGELQEKNKQLEDKVKTMDGQLDEIRATLSETKIKLATEKESHYHASSQISLINNLVSQIVSGPELDLDRLARFLEENHALINELTAKGDIDYVASALVGVAGGIVEMPKEEKPDIAGNLGKVWRVLIELLSHHKKSENGSNQEWESCYKSVDTPKGPKLVISVSQTFIKLKDLILEKNKLVKEVGRLKTLNEHLESRTEEQENRLTLVTEELHNTWDVVNKLKTQHENLHTHEKILRDELQHKRVMLNGLKKQLGICKEQWTLAREKNSKTENDWMLLRDEFASRKKKKQFFSSAESGYEDEETQSPEYDTDEDKSLEIEEESPETMYTNLMQNSDVTSPLLLHVSNVSQQPKHQEDGVISEILDGVIDEALQIVAATKGGADPERKPVPKNLPLYQVAESKPKCETKILNQGDSNSPPKTDRIEFKFDSDFLSPISEEVIQENVEVIENSTVEDSFSSESSKVKKIDTEEKYEEEVEDIPIVLSETKIEDTNECETPPESTIKEGEEEINGCSSTNIETGSPTTDEVLRRREERLSRMEESCKSLFVKMGQTTNRSNEIVNKLDQIHAVYGPNQSSNQTEQQESSEQQPRTSQEEPQPN